MTIQSRTIKELGQDDDISHAYNFEKTVGLILDLYFRPKQTRHYTVMKIFLQLVLRNQNA